MIIKEEQSKLRSTIALLSSMVNGGEQHSEQSRKEVSEALSIVNNLPIQRVMPRFDFGDYTNIEQKRYRVDNEQYLHKVIGRGRSNTWVDVPVQTPIKETIHDHMEDVIRCVCCGVDKQDVLKYRASDVKPNGV